MNRKKAIIPLITVAALLLLYLLAPLKSRDWDIKPNKKLEEGKESYLNRLLSRSFRKKSPYIIIISADDLGKTDISLYGGALKTPSIDSIGSSGVTFTEGYATSPVCSPSRAGLMTGRYQNRFGFASQPMTRYPQNRFEFFVYDKVIDTYPMVPRLYKNYPYKREMEKQGLPPSEIIIPEVLGSVGYQTAIFGKWHLGYSSIHAPNERGFDQFYGFLEAFTLYDDPKKEEVVNYYHTVFHEKYIWSQKRKKHAAIQRNGEVIKEDRFLTDAITEEAIAFMESHTANSSDPFFLYLPYSAPHTPFQALRLYYDQFSDIESEPKRVYAAMIAHLDDAVGKILSTVDRLGIREETMIIFISDNGGALYTEATKNEPLKGGKFAYFEGGINVPFMIQWPEKIEAGQVVDTPVIQSDIFPTLLKSAAVPLPEERVIDGIDLMEVIAGEADDRALFWRVDYNRAIRKGEWKLLVNVEDDTLFLYNLKNDKEERKECSAEYPQVVDELLSELQEWIETLPPEAWPRVMDYHFEIDGVIYRFAI